jgi:hypothetical protein
VSFAFLIFDIFNVKLYQEKSIETYTFAMKRYMFVEEAPELFYKLDEIDESADNKHQQKSEITIEIIRDIVAWDKKISD